MSEMRLSVLSQVYPGVTLLGHIAILFLIFWGILAKTLNWINESKNTGTLPSPGICNRVKFPISFCMIPTPWHSGKIIGEWWDRQFPWKEDEQMEHRVFWEPWNYSAWSYNGRSVLLHVSKPTGCVTPRANPCKQWIEGVRSVRMWVHLS